jgi:MHS family proline/betaine transporter-like MFS transporter
MAVLGVWMGVVSLGVYLVVGFLPGYLSRAAGLSPVEAYTTNLVAVLALAVSALIGGYLVDICPLRPLAIGLMAGVAVVAVPGILVITGGRSLGTALIGQSLWTMFLGAAYTVGTVLAVTLFPVAIRFTATALALNVGVAALGSTAPYVSTWAVAATGSLIAPGVYLFTAALGGLLAALFVRPHRDGPDPP